jgi:hypothetical protein
MLPGRMRISIHRRYASVRSIGTMRVLTAEDEPGPAEAIRDTWPAANACDIAHRIARIENADPQLEAGRQAGSGPWTGSRG